MAAKADVKTTERMAVIVFLLLLLMVVYQNCGSPVRMTENMVHKLSSGDLQSLQQLELFEKQSLCESPNFYSCEHRVSNTAETPAVVRCFHHAIQIETDFPVSAESDSLDIALAHSMSKCREILVY